MCDNILTLNDIKLLEKNGYVIGYYPRKKEICINGSKYYKLKGNKYYRK